MSACAGLTAGAVAPLGMPPLAWPAGAAGVVAVEPLTSPGTAAPPGPDPFADAGAGLTGMGTGLAADGFPAAGAEAAPPADGIALPDAGAGTDADGMALPDAGAGAGADGFAAGGAEVGPPADGIALPDAGAGSDARGIVLPDGGTVAPDAEVWRVGAPEWVWGPAAGPPGTPGMLLPPDDTVAAGTPLVAAGRAWRTWPRCPP